MAIHSDERNKYSSLRPLFVEARQKGLWFYCHMYDCWLSPDRLQEMQNSGEFIIHALYWQLRDPHERIVEIEKEIDAKQAEKQSLLAEIKNETRKTRETVSL